MAHTGILFDLDHNFDPPANASIVTSVGRGQYGDVQIWTRKLWIRNGSIPDKVAVKETFTKPLHRLEGTVYVEEKAEMLLSLEHDNIVKTLQLYSLANIGFMRIVMEACDGNLDHLLHPEREDETGRLVKMDRSFTEDDLRYLGRQIISGLHYLHETGIAHRDIKPANILVDNLNSNMPKLKLADFGFSKHMADDVAKATALGTPHYMPPEIARAHLFGQKEALYDGKKSDIFSCGVTFYQILKQEVPFQLGELGSPYYDHSTFINKCGIGSHVLSSILSVMLTWEPATRASTKELLDHVFLATASRESIILSEAQLQHIHRNEKEIKTPALLEENDDFPALHTAARDGNLEEVKRLLELIEDVNKTTETMMTPLHLACSNGHPLIVNTLIQKKAHVNRVDLYGQTPLHLACLAGHTDVVLLLIKNGAYLNIPDNSDFTPLHLAAKTGHTKMTKLLIGHGAVIDSVDHDGQTALHLASSTGQYPVAELLIVYGAFVNRPNSHGFTPLHLASEAGHADLIKLLLEKGADIEVFSHNGTTALHLASGAGHVEAVRFLIENGAYVGRVDMNGTTPLHLASKGGHIDVAKLIIAKGEELSADPAEKYRTTLRFLGAWHQIEPASTSTGAAEAPTGAGPGMVTATYGKGWQLDATDKSGTTPLHLAAEGGHTEMASLLIKHGSYINRASPHVTNVYHRNTPLHLACKNGHYGTARLLIEKKADKLAMNNDGDTPLDLAMKQVHDALFELFR